MLVSLALAASLALAGASAASAATSLSRTPVHLELQSIMTPMYSVGEFDGALTLTINPDGIVNGYYRPSSGSVKLVSGGTDGDHIWFDIGNSGDMRVSGRLKNGTIHGVVIVRGFFDPLKFVAKKS